MENMVMMGDIKIPKEAISRQIAELVDLIVQVKRFRDGSRPNENVTEVVAWKAKSSSPRSCSSSSISTRAPTKERRQNRSMGLRPYTLEKAKQFGFHQPYLEACL